MFSYFSHFMFLHSIAIGREGGVPPLIALARSDAEVNVLFIVNRLPRKNFHFHARGIIVRDGNA